MHTFFIAHRRSIATLIISTLWIGLFTIWKGLVTASPIDVVMFLDTQNQVEQSVSIFSPEQYTVNLVIERGNKSPEAIEKLLGSMRPLKAGESSSQPEISIPLEWKLSDVTDGKVVASGNAASGRSNGWSAAQVSRAIGFFSAPVGKYTFTAKTLNPLPEFSGVPTRIVAQTRGSSSSTWQMAFLWFGNIGTFLIAWPTAFLALVYLLYRISIFSKSEVASEG